MIKVHEDAKSQITRLMSESGYDVTKDYVRVKVKSGGCSGLSYDLSFDKSIGEGDEVYEDAPVKIAVDKQSFLYLIGTTLEYSGEIGRATCRGRVLIREVSRESKDGVR